MLLFRLLLLLLPLLLLVLVLVLVVPGRGQRETEKTNFHFHFVGSAAHRRQNKWMTDVRDTQRDWDGGTVSCVGNPFSSWPKDRQTNTKRDSERVGGRENQEMRLTFEQWARKGNEVLCGGPHVAPTRGRSTRRMLNLNEVPTLLIAPLPLPQSFSWFTAFNDAVYFAFDAPKEKN